MQFSVGYLIDPKIHDRWLIEKNLPWSIKTRSCLIYHVESIWLDKYHVVVKIPYQISLILARIINFDRSINRPTCLNFDWIQHMVIKYWLEPINDRVWLAWLRAFSSTSIDRLINDLIGQKNIIELPFRWKNKWVANHLFSSMIYNW